MLDTEGGASPFAPPRDSRGRFRQRATMESAGADTACVEALGSTALAAIFGSWTLRNSHTRRQRLVSFFAVTDSPMRSSFERIGTRYLTVHTSCDTSCTSSCLSPTPSHISI